MGTNYYYSARPPCTCCGRPYESRHIGKSSFGWVFGLRVYPDDGINDLPDWQKLFEAGGTIEDQYGRVISTVEMLSIITDRRNETIAEKPFGYRSWADFHRLTESEPGPNGLLRRSQTAAWRETRQVKAGAGTWDLCYYDFS